MSSAQEREEMQRKLAGMDDKVADARTRLDQIPFTRESEALRDMAAGLLDSLRNLNDQMCAALADSVNTDTETCSVDTSEGGNEHGS